MKFRHHRGSLKESMDNAVEVSNMEALKELIQKEYNFLSIKKIHFKYMLYDKRINWDTYLVLVDFTEVAAKLPVGWSNGEL